MNTTDLLESLKRHTLYPSSSIKYSDTDFVKAMNEQMLWAIQTEFVAMNEDYFISKIDIPLSGKNTYNTPKMATCWSFDQVMYVDGNGVENLLPRWAYKMENVVPNSADRPYGIILEDSFLKLYPNVSTSPTGSLRVYFRKLLNELTEVSNCGQIITVADGGLTWDCTLDSVPVGNSSGLDAINGDNPYEVYMTNQKPNVVGLVASFLKTACDHPPLPGDYFAPTGFTPLPHLPKEWHSLISICASVSILASNGNQAQYELKKAERDEMIAQVRRVNSRRINSSPKRIVDRRYQLNAARYRGRNW